VRKLLVVVGLILAIGLAALGTEPSRPVTAVTANWVVDDNMEDCLTPSAGASFDNIGAAVNIVSAGETIFVCPGEYPEQPLIIDDANVILMGPGATPDVDGMATVQVALPGFPGESNQVRIAANGVSVLGLDFDGTRPPGHLTYMIPIGGEGDNLLISDNTFHDIDGHQGAINISGTAPSDNVQMFRNHSVAEVGGIRCQCNNSRAEDNILESSTINAGAARFIGDDNVFQGNTADGYVIVTGYRATIAD